MRWLRTILAEIYGLFVDDGRFALAIMMWLAVIWLVASRSGVPHGVVGPILFTGLATILLASTAWQARRVRPKTSATAE